MNRRDWLTATAVASGTALLGAWLWRRTSHRVATPEPTRPTAVGSGPVDEAAALAALWQARYPRPEGGELVLAELRGRPLVLNFWATWCPPCVREMPELDRFAREFGPRGWQVVGLAVDQLEPVRAFLGRTPVSFPIGLTGFAGNELARALGNPAGGLPFSVLIGADGRVIQRKLGATDHAELARWAR